MKIASSTAVKLFARGANAGEPITFAGEPALLEADVWLHNEEAEDLILRRATMTSKALQRHLPAEEIARISVPRVVPAHQRKLVSMSFDLDPTIPSGTYDAEIRLEGETGSKSFRARIIVTQNYALSLDPDEFVFAAGAGERIAGEVIVSNEGNVAVDVTPMGEYRLEDPDLRERCLCCGARLEQKEKHRQQHDVDEEEEDFGAVVITNEHVTVQPGHWALVKFNVRLPPSLPANAHLRARPRIGNERFNLDLLTPLETASATKPRSLGAKKKSD